MKILVVVGPNPASSRVFRQPRVSSYTNMLLGCRVIVGERSMSRIVVVSREQIFLFTILFCTTHVSGRSCKQQVCVCVCVRDPCYRRPKKTSPPPMVARVGGTRVRSRRRVRPPRKPWSDHMWAGCTSNRGEGYRTAFLQFEGHLDARDPDCSTCSNTTNTKGVFFYAISYVSYTPFVVFKTCRRHVAFWKRVRRRFFRFSCTSCLQAVNT